MSPESTLGTIPRLTTNLLITLKLLALFGIFLYGYPLYLILIFTILVCISVTGEFFSSHAIKQGQFGLLSAIYTGLALLDALVFAAVLVVFKLFGSDFYLLGLLSLIVIPFRGGLLVGFISGIFICCFYLAMGWNQLSQMSLMLRTASLLAVCLASGYWGELLQQETYRRQKAQRQIQKMREINRLKNEFVSVAVHNLRSPLTSLKGYWEVLGEESLSQNEKRGFLDQMRSVLANLERLVDDMLEISRLKLGGVSGARQRVKVYSLIQEIHKAFGPAAKAKGLQYSYENKISQGVRLEINPRMFKNALSNLLDNAIKYTRNGRITLESWSSEKRLFLRVADTGQGISKDDQPNIFKAFYRGKAEKSERFKGTGLGLYIVKKFVLSNGGEISFTSEEGKGTAFTLSFPIAGEGEFLNSF